jgi:signal transduction histidine kinase
MFETRVATSWRYPLTFWVVLLAAVFLVEYGVMLALPGLLPRGASRVLESAVDSVALTLLLAPILWWMLVRPLRETIRLRAKFLTDFFEQIETDRRRTARDLHDGVGQSLTLLISGLRSAQSCRANADCRRRIEDLQRIAEQALAEARRLALGLRPSLLDDLGLVPALERLVDDLRDDHGIILSLDADEVAGMRLSEPVATAVFRIVQEALTNVIKHSQAREAAVRVTSTPGEVRLEVRDDGCGIDPSRLSSLPIGRLGLRGMSERAVLLGGKFSVDSAPGRGVCITASIPTGDARLG